MAIAGSLGPGVRSASRSRNQVQAKVPARAPAAARRSSPDRGQELLGSTTATSWPWSRTRARPMARAPSPSWRAARAHSTCTLGASGPAASRIPTSASICSTSDMRLGPQEHHAEELVARDLSGGRPEGADLRLPRPHRHEDPVDALLDEVDVGALEDRRAV